MSNLLELLGQGLEASLMSLVLPQSRPLNVVDAEALTAEIVAHPDHLWNRLRLGIHHTQMAATDKAGKMFATIIQSDPEHLEARLAWAAMYAAAGSLSEAIAQLEKAREYHGCESRVLFALGYCYERQGQDDKAIELYLAGKNYAPYLRQLTQRCAAIYLRRRDYDGAIDQCRQLINEHPEDTLNYIMLGQLLLQTRSYGQAAAAFERALTIEPDNFEMPDDQIEALVREGGLDEAIGRVTSTIATQGDFPDSYVQLADLYSQSGDDEKAVCNYERAIELYPGFLEAAVKLGTQHLRMKRYYEAATKFSDAVEINDRLITTYVGLGLSQYQDGQKELAGDTLDLAAALEPNSNLLFAEVVRLQVKLAQQKRLDRPGYEFLQAVEANVEDTRDAVDVQLERYQRALTRNPNRADLRYHYAMLLRGIGQRDGAIEHLEHTLRINPSYSRARLKLGLALREAGEKDRAISELMKGLTAQPEYVDLHYKLGLMYCDKMLFALAVEHLGTTMDTGGSDADVQVNLALALQNMGLVNRAAAAWRTVCELEPESAIALHAERSHMSLRMMP